MLSFHSDVHFDLTIDFLVPVGRVHRYKSSRELFEFSDAAFPLCEHVRKLPLPQISASEGAPSIIFGTPPPPNLARQKRFPKKHRIFLASLPPKNVKSYVTPPTIS